MKKGGRAEINTRAMFTAKFKRDYVAAAAVMIFFLIVFSEIVLAISIPAYFVKSDLWAINMQRQELFSKFDYLRSYCEDAKIKNNDAEEENKLVYWTLNSMANYLRANRNSMDSETARELLKNLVELNRIASRVQSKGAYNTALPLEGRKALGRAVVTINRLAEGE